MSKDDAERHAQRADEMGDAMRRYLFAANSGAIGVLVAIAGRGTELPTWPASTWLPLVPFILGLIVTLRSLMIQKGKALCRYDAEMKDEPLPDFSRFPWRNEYYEIASLVLFIVGVLAVIALRLELC